MTKSNKQKHGVNDDAENIDNHTWIIEPDRRPTYFLHSLSMPFWLYPY